MASKVITAESIVYALEAYIFKEAVKDHDEKIALACVSALFKCLHLNFRSTLMYVPTMSNDHSSLHESIYRDFNGNNHMELSIKYRRSLQNIYTIIKAQSCLEINKRQVNIFPFPDLKKSKTITQIVFEEYLFNDLIDVGLSAENAQLIASKLFVFLCQEYPGISICISDKMQKKRDYKGQDKLF